jgi:hypothetical protein
VKARLSALFCASVVAVVVAAPAAAAHPSPELEIEAPPGFESTVTELKDIGMGDFSASLLMTGLMGFTSSIRVVIAPPDGPIAGQTPRWVSGFADGSSRVIVLFPDRVSSYPDDNLSILVHHEVTHVLVAQAARGRPVPRWFNEGLATVAAREWGIEDRARYAAAVVGRGPRSTAELDAGFAAGGRRASRSYALSAAFVRWLRAEYGKAMTAHVLEMLGQDMSFPEAFVRATGDPLEVAEHRFFVREAIWHTWVPFLTSTGALWAAITTLALIAIGRRRRKSAAMHHRWELEEQIVSGVPEPEKPTRLDFTRSRSLDETDDDVVN